MDDDPLSFTFRYVMSLNTTVRKFVSYVVNNDIPSASVLMEKVHTVITNSQTSRCTYCVQDY